MFKKIVFYAGMLSVFLLVLNGCGTPKNDVSFQKDGSDIVGVITDINGENGELINGRILVELEQPNNTSDKFWVTIEKNTPIYEYDGNQNTNTTFKSLEKGQSVEIWFDGPVAESYPAQVKAKQIVVRIVTDYDSLVYWLRSFGASVEHETLPEVVVQDFFSVTGQIFKVNGEQVQVFEYDDYSEAEEEAALVSPDGTSVGTSMPFWMAPPHFYMADRIIVLYVGENAVVTEALESVLGEQFAGQQIENNQTQSEKAAIYATVVRQLATEDDTFGGNLNPTTLYIIRNTDDSAGNPVSGEKSDSKMIADSVISKISSLLTDLSVEIIWIDKFEDAKFEESGSAVKQGGVIITLGNIYPQEDSSVHVAGSIYIANLAAGGSTYILEQVDGSWKITGRVGPVWMS